MTHPPLSTNHYPLTTAQAADLFVDGSARLEAFDHPTELLRSGPVRFARWGPDGRRATVFTEEFFPVGMAAADALEHVRAASLGPHHDVTMVGGEADDPHGAFAAAGYRLESPETLMALDLRRAPADEPDHPVTPLTDADVERSHALQLEQTGRVRRIAPGQLAHPAVLVRQVSVGGAPAAVGTAVVLGRARHVSSVATLPAFRRRGLARSLMLGLHAAARDAGAQAVVLTSSEMGRPLYLGLGYAALAPIVLWEPDFPPPAVPGRHPDP